MVSHAFGQPIRNMKGLVERLRKKSNKGLVTKANFVDIISPINQQSAPNHYSKHGKVNPMKPANRQWMFFDYFFHESAIHDSRSSPQSLQIKKPGSKMPAV